MRNSHSVCAHSQDKPPHHVLLSHPHPFITPDPCLGKCRNRQVQEDTAWQAPVFKSAQAGRVAVAVPCWSAAVSGVTLEQQVGVSCVAALVRSAAAGWLAGHAGSQIDSLAACPLLWFVTKPKRCPRGPFFVRRPRRAAARWPSRRAPRTRS
jgi:hypothetical protein